MNAPEAELSWLLMLKNNKINTELMFAIMDYTTELKWNLVQTYQGPHRMNLWTFPLVPPAGRSFNLSSKITQHLLDVWCNILYRHLCCSEGVSWLCWWSPLTPPVARHLSFEINILTAIRWNAVKFGTDIHVPLRITSNNSDFSSGAIIKTFGLWPNTS